MKNYEEVVKMLIVSDIYETPRPPLWWMVKANE